MKPDITNRTDIETLVNSFYKKVIIDDKISFFFIDVIPVNWEKHLPIMYDFWEQIVFGTGNYNGNPMNVHLALNKKSTITHEHFQQWIALFNETVDELFSGDKANLIKQRATSIATVIQIKIMS